MLSRFQHSLASWRVDLIRVIYACIVLDKRAMSGKRRKLQLNDKAESAVVCLRRMITWTKAWLTDCLHGR